jgi:hypothetical protein
MTSAINASDPSGGDWWGAVIEDSLYGRQAFHCAKVSVQQRVHCRSCPTVWREAGSLPWDDCILSKAKICENCCAYFALALSFQPPAKPAPAELTKLFESVASFANMGAGSDWLIIALHTGQD